MIALVPKKPKSTKTQICHGQNNSKSFSQQVKYNLGDILETYNVFASWHKFKGF